MQVRFLQKSNVCDPEAEQQHVKTLGDDKMFKLIKVIPLCLLCAGIINNPAVGADARDPAAFSSVFRPASEEDGSKIPIRLLEQALAKHQAGRLGGDSAELLCLASECSIPAHYDECS
ncbi:MAG: hypothetical protein WCG04_06740 [Alphaproteobacteria bacterium]